MELSISQNELHSGTVVGQEYNGNVKTELHWDPKLKEMVVIDTWAVANGIDDVDYEFEVMEKFTKVDEFVKSPYYQLLNKVA